MIPPLISTEAPPGERLVFERLATDPVADDWIVLHSLDIASHVRQTQGEADFVVLVPQQGIAVLEVKSHSTVARMADGRWQLGKAPATSRGPFQQASEAMHSIRQYLIGRGIDLRAVPMVSGVLFTHVRARSALPPTPEWHDWQLMDLQDLRAGIAKAVTNLLTNGRQHLAAHIPAMATRTNRPDRDKLSKIANMLRPRFELGTLAVDMRRDREDELVAFLDEQYDALDAMADNRSVLFTGPAGSGKTFLALEAARREAGTGNTGRLLCFNRKLGQHLSSIMTTDIVRVSSFHAELLRITGDSPPLSPDPAFWTKQLVDHAIDRLLDTDNAGDYLIVDEIQDLSQAAYLDVLDLLVKGGLAGGRCLFFGDFERQALYDVGDGRGELKERMPSLATCVLTANCRNRPRIGAAVELLADMSPGYKRFRRTDDGAMPRYYWYEDATTQTALLANAIRDLQTDGYGLDEIVVLSPRSRHSAAHAAIASDAWLRRILVRDDTTMPRKGRVRFDTVHSYKGLEAPAVVLTDVDDAGAPRFDALLYVGLTRATDRVSVLANRRALRPIVEPVS